MKKRSQFTSVQKRRARGFSLIELLLAVVVIVIMLAIALPSAMRAYQTYQLASAARQVSGVVQFSRFEAIRLNMPVNCLIQQASGSQIQIWTDSNGDGIAQPTEKQAIFSGSVEPVSAGSVPGTGGLAAALGVSTITAVNPANGTITFDRRGAVRPAGFYAIYLDDAGTPSAGYQAVVLLPAGAVQVWYSDAYGNWHQTN